MKKKTDAQYQKEQEEYEEAEEKPAPKEKAPAFQKTDAHCTVEGCQELKEPGQTYVCSRHVRAG